MTRPKRQDHQRSLQRFTSERRARTSDSRRSLRQDRDGLRKSPPNMPRPLPIDVTLLTETTSSLFVQSIENMRSTILVEAYKRT